MKELFKNIYYAFFQEELIQKEQLVIIPKTNREKLLELALAAYNTDPTPKDIQPDEVACAESLSTIIKKLLPDFQVIVYTPDLLKYIKNDKRFKETTEFKEGNIIISPTKTGNGSVIGHCGIFTKGGKILSNSSSTGLWYDKFDNISWIDRYSRKGGLELYVFELL